jgi:hypothetical protein
MSYYGTPYMGTRGPLSSTDQSGWPLLVSSGIRTQAPNFFCICSSNLNLMSHACRLSNQLYWRKKRTKKPPQVSHPYSIGRIISTDLDTFTCIWTERARSEYFRALARRSCTRESDHGRRRRRHRRRAWFSLSLYSV